MDGLTRTNEVVDLGVGSAITLDLKDGWPLLASDEEAIFFGVAGDAVEDGFGVDALVVGEESGEVNLCDDMSFFGRDAGDAVGMPDVWSLASCGSLCSSTRASSYS
jgi:hypothetical protein